MANKKFFVLPVIIFSVLFSFTVTTSAAITEQGPAIDGLFGNATVGGGAIIPLAQFRLAGSDNLTKVGFQIIASTTMTQGEISRVSLWKDSGTTPGFQVDQDTFIAGAASTTPLVDGTLIVLTPGTAVPVDSTGVQFYIVASTTRTANITNGHAFNILLQANYASTSALTGVGTAFASNKKINLNQSATIKISEVMAGSTGNTSDEFIELYNSGDADINLQDLPLQVHSFYTGGTINGSSTPSIPLTYYKKVIPSHGYFLITNPIGYSASVPTDATFSTSTFNILLPNGGLSIATGTPGTTATSTAIDYIGWGTQPAGNCENADTAGTACAPALLEDGSSLERLAVGFPMATSTAGSMFQGGVDATKGNGVDRNDNSAEFVSQATSSPQNSMSPIEFPFGGGGSDTSKLQVQGSFPMNGMTNAPIDITYIGFMLNKPVATTTIISASATTTVVLRKTSDSTGNLCTTVTYNSFPSNFEPPAKCNLSAALSPNTSYTFVATSTIYDLSGNALDQDAFQPGNQPYTATFTTGAAGFTSTNVTPPMVIGVSPFQGSQNVPTSIKKISIEFNQATMDTATFTNGNIFLSGGLTLSSFFFSTSTGRNVLTATIGGTVLANTTYTLTVGTGGVRTLAPASISLPSTYTSTFTTGSSADTSAPAIVGVLPTALTTITANTSDFVFTFDDALDGTTATSGAITLGILNGANLPGSVRYDPVSKEGHFTTSNVLPVGQTLVLTIKGASIRNISNVLLGTDVTKQWTVEPTNTDITGPAILFVNANEFTVAITFNEAVNATDATTLGNYTVTVGGTAQTLSALAGHTLTYDASTRTAKLSGLRVAPGVSIVVSANNIKDVSGNLPNAAMSGSATVSSSFSGGGGGFVDPGSFSGSTFGTKVDFSSSGIGFMPPVNIRPTSTFISASSTYAFELPISKQIDDGGTIVITLPSSSDFGLCCVATTSSKNPFLASVNSDINGSSDGTIAINTIVTSTSAKTITLTLKATGSGITGTRKSGSDEHDFLKFSLADLVNPSIPKGMDTSGYSIDIKSKNAAGALLESFSANPVYIGGGTAGGGAVTTIRGTVSGNGGVLVGATIHMMSPQTGPMDATTNSAGLFTFSNIPVGSQFLTNNFGGGSSYMLFTDPFVSGISDANGATSTAFFGNTMPTPIQATSTSFLTRNFALTATSSAINFTVKLAAAASTFGASENVDVFAGGPGQFVVRTVTPGTGTSLVTPTTLTVIPIPQTNGFWNIGIGPAMPKSGGGGFSGPPPMPNWSMPKPISVTVTGCPSACVSSVSSVATTTNTFTISTADKTISGVLKDGSGNSIANAMVFAYSPNTDSGGGSGSNTQTSTSGTFSLKVVAGSYVVGAFSPGVGESRKVTVVMNSSGTDVFFVDGSPTASTGSSGANPFVLKMVKPGYTITGQVTDGTNPVGNAPVFAYRTDGPGRADALTDSSTGNYTIYVDNGTWKVSSFIPGFGPMAEQTVTISNASQSSINFAPSSSQSFSIYSGNIYEDLNDDNRYATTTEAIVGAVIRLSNGTSVNEGVSGADGAFSIRVPSATGYTIKDIFSPSYGKIAPYDSTGTAIGTFSLTASSTNKYIRVPVRDTVNFTIKDSNGNPLVVSKAFIDLIDKTTGLGNHIEITNATSTSLLIASSTSPTIRAYIQGIPPANISVASDSAQTFVTSGNLSVSHATEAVKITVNTSSTGAAMSNIVGTVYKTVATAGNELDGAWIQFVDQTNGVQFGTQATSTGGYSIKAANGTYQVLVSKPQYVGSPTTVTVSGTTTQNFVLTASSLTISGTVTAGGVAAVSAFVRGEKVGGGQAVTQTDTSGTYTLNVTPGTWRIFAAADGYTEGASASNPVTVSTSQSSINVALTTASSLQSKLATSNTFSDKSAGSFNDSTVNTKVSLDANALGSSDNQSYITAKETSNYPNTTSVNIVANKAKDISAFSGGSQVTNITGKADIELTYTKAELASSGILTMTGVSKLSVVSYSDEKKDWETLSTVPTYLDSAGAALASPSADLSNVVSVSFAAQGTHFSAYALSSSEGVSPPDTPGGLAATVGIADGSPVALTWGTVSTAEGYYIYRSTSSTGTFALVADVSGGSSVSYSNSSVTAGTTYYYKIAAYKSSGASESAASSAVSATVSANSGNGAPGGGGGGGGGGGAPVPRAQKIYPDGTTVYLDEVGAQQKIAELDKKFALKTASQVVMAEKAPVAPSVSPSVAGVSSAKSYAFTRALKAGSEGSDVLSLQTFLEAKGFLKMPQGVAKGYFGQATRIALMKYQKSVGLEQVGALGSQTRAKINAETVAEMVVPSTPSVGAGAAVSVKIEISRSVKKGSVGMDVKAIQQILNADADTRIANSGSGSPGNETDLFGTLTEKAIGKFQLKYGIAKPGDESYGSVGPKTRAKLNELIKALGEVSKKSTEAPGASVESGAGETDAVAAKLKAKAELEAQINAAIEHIKQLQTQLKP